MTSNHDPDPNFCLPSSFAILSTDHQQKLRKKRTRKLIEIERYLVPSSATTTAAKKTKYSGKKPDPSAPKITRPCSECGKKFWSWKALFGHMRCHPERQWRGINPPPDYCRPVSPIRQLSTSATTTTHVETLMTEEDHEVASCLLMLANRESATLPLETTEFGGDVGGAGNNSTSQDQDDEANCRLECSSWKKVFGSHQALGGHGDSHKNIVKGFFAITESDGCEVVDEDRGGIGGVKENVEDNVGDSKLVMELGGYKCSICSRVFSSGQALGGHKRCHWVKGEEAMTSSSINQGLHSLAEKGLDLNLPAPIDDKSSSSYASGLTLDLSLGL